MIPGLFELEATIRREVALLGKLSWPPVGAIIPGLRVGFGGPARSGKTALVRALLGVQADAVLARIDRHTRTVAPIEYRFGPDTKITVQRPKDGSWIPLPRPPRAVNVSALLDEVGHDFNAALVELPILEIGHWNASFVDLPPIGIEPHLNAIALSELAKCDAIFWVMHPRGLGDAELAVLQNLERIPVAFVSNVWDDHLTPTSIPIEVVEVPFRGTEFPTALPLIAANCIDVSEERQLLLDVLGLLRRSQLEACSRDVLQKFPDFVLQIRTMTAHGSERGLVTLKNRFAAVELLERLDALRALLTFQNHLNQIVIPTQTRLKVTQDQIENHIRTPIEECFEANVRRAKRLAVTYNIRAGAKKKTTGAPNHEGNQAYFGERFIKPRAELEAFLQNALQTKDELMLGTHDVKALEGLSDNIRDGRVEIALLGVFSSGKSALVNRLLGVPINDQDSELLPTRPTVTTATVNRIEWAQSKQLNGVEWLDETELTFLQKDSNVGVRVREIEILAIQHWLKTGTVKIEECEFQEFEPKHNLRPLDGRALLDSLLRAVAGRNGRCPTYLDIEPDARHAGKVTIRKFHGARPNLVAGMLLKDAFKLAERPEVALQVAMLRVGYPHPLLKFGAIIDTPGTDSHLPHHRTLSRSLVSKRRVPVIYCLPSSSPGGIEDRRNLKVLLDGGAETMRRVFFVITRKGDIVTAAERDEVRRYVKQRLADFGMPVQSLHFIELLQFVDQEFIDFSAQLTEFIKAEQGPQLAAWSNRARTILQQASENATTQLSELDLKETERALQETSCKRRFEALLSLAGTVVGSREWGAPYVIRRVDEQIVAACATLDEAIKDLNDKDQFDDFASSLAWAVKDLNRKGIEVTRRSLHALHSKFSSELGAIKERPPVEFMLDDDDYFDASAAITAAESVDFSMLGAIWSGFNYGPQVEKARKAIARPWEATRKKGLEAYRKAVNASLEYYQTEVFRILEQAGKELESIQIRDPAEQEFLRERLSSAKILADGWVKRFSDWEKQYVE